MEFAFCIHVREFQPLSPTGRGTELWVVPDCKMLHLLAGTLRPVAVVAVNGNELSGRQEKEFFLYLVSGLEGML